MLPPSHLTDPLFLRQVDTAEMTLEKFVTLVVKQRLGLVEPFLMLGSAIVYEEGDDSDDSLSNSILSPLEKCIGGGIKDGSIVTLGDFRQDITVTFPASLFAHLLPFGTDLVGRFPCRPQRFQ